MEKLILFDIDGTLVSAPRMDRFPRAVKNVYDLDVDFDWDHWGLTDKLILERLLKDKGWNDEDVDQAIPLLFEEIERIHAAEFQTDKVIALPGVKVLLERLHGHSDVQLGLITGNIETIAQRKLASVDLYKYFYIGGFGSDPHLTRADLINVAMQKAGVADKNQVYVIGDTPRDIFAAQDAGIIHSVGVANAFRDTQELIDAGAETVFENFTDTQAVVSAFGLN